MKGYIDWYRACEGPVSARLGARACVGGAFALLACAVTCCGMPCLAAAHPVIRRVCSPALTVLPLSTWPAGAAGASLL